MRKTMRIFSTLLATSLVVLLVTSSCSDEAKRDYDSDKTTMRNSDMEKSANKADPADNAFFIGNYKGKISYRNSTKGDKFSKDVQEGNVEVVKIGDSYTFIFSDKIPNIANVMFDKKGDHSVISVGSNESHYIKINDNTLTIRFVDNDEKWTADCIR